MAGTAKQSIRFLLIDDDEDDRYLIRSLLEEGGQAQPGHSFEIVEASHYQEALEKLLEQTWDYVIVDNYLGSAENNGIKLINEVYLHGLKPPTMLLISGKQAVGFSERDYRVLGRANARLIAKQNLTWEVLARNIGYIVENDGQAQAKNKVTSVLVVEDNTDDFDALKEYFCEHDEVVVELLFFLVQAKSFQQAIELLEKDQWDIVLIDYKLLGSKTGLDVIHTCRERGIQVPTGFISSYDQSSIPLNEEDLLALEKNEIKYIKKGELTLEKLLYDFADYIRAFH